MRTGADMVKCLIIDDSEAIRDVTARLVADLGHETLQAAGAALGLEACVKIRPQVVFLDWDLPDFAALDFLGGVGDMPEELRPEIVICAMQNDPRQFALAREAGARFCLLKPYNGEEVAHILHDILIMQGPAQVAV